MRPTDHDAVNGHILNTRTGSPTGAAGACSVKTALAASGSRWPGQCEVCRQWSAGRICASCQARYAQPAMRCVQCGLRLGLGLGRLDASEPTHCGACLLRPPPFLRTLCAVDYGFPWDRLVAAFKFHGQPELATCLADCMALAARAQQSAPGGLVWPQALLPVPLAPSRLAQRGYNQAWELARRLGRSLGLPAWHDCISRPVDTAHQSELGREQRLRNLRSAFLVEPRRRAHLQGLHVALVDDVMTTGATVGEVAAELLRSGARQVDVWVLARTPAPQLGSAPALGA